MQLTAENLVCERGGRRVFENLSFQVDQASSLVLLGPNGSGKTSLLRMIAGLVEVSGGTLRLDGRHEDLTVAQHCHLIAHQEALKPSLTVRENLAFWTGFLGGSAIDEALEAFDLARLAPYSAGLLSAGQKRRLALARLVAVPRAIWLLDEPTVGLDARSLERLQSVMNQHLDQGGIIIAATHIDTGLKNHQTLDFSTLEGAA